MNICRYTNKECETARADGECRIGSQNCGWENWESHDDCDDVRDDVEWEE